MNIGSNEHTLSIEAHDRPATIERLLRVIRHRGYRLCKMSVESSQEDERIAVSVTVNCEKSVNFLQQQLAKLVDVSSVEVASINEETNQLRISA
ncbi:acetolactate synthase 2 small subunit [Echinimonas agarilytica]|uniref:Acetolactate synthase 2 small subunit n=1 Tax=Echinimonas agarilytica TaxID=1215918 RepID=A0AA42B5Z3_9GAMM|nr:acetolactate synthase 2 small subunit [Echinimonas agarilytica]MCM2678205.1 acetolactate synthase 2 small subunit [Echinimonas agarilytica]